MTPLRLTLINPNTNAAATSEMLDIAREAAPDAVDIQGVTAPFGSPLITTPEKLEEAARAVMSLAPGLRAQPVDGVIIAAFGDPALLSLRAAIDAPVTGIAEAGMAAGARGGRRFAVVTTTGNLSDAIAAAAIQYGHADAFCGIRLTSGDATFVMADPKRLLDALSTACQEAIDLLGAEALVIGGGPLARAARALKPRFAVPIIEPVPEAVLLAASRVRSTRPEIGGLG